MNTASKNKELEMRLDTRGKIDIDYYLHKAEAIRAQYLAELIVSAKQGIKSSISEFYQKFICLKCQPTH